MITSAYCLEIEPECGSLDGGGGGGGGSHVACRLPMSNLRNDPVAYQFKKWSDFRGLEPLMTIIYIMN